MSYDVVFDLDGTLVDTSGDIIDCLHTAFDRVFRSPSGVQISKSSIGPPLSEMVAALSPGISDDKRAAVIRAFRDCYDRSDYPKTRPYKGVLPALDRLDRAGVRMFIATNKPRVPALRILRFLPPHCFCDVVTPEAGEAVLFSKSEMLSYMKAKWNLRGSYYVGDSPQDIIAAHENGMYSIAVLYGYGKEEELSSQKPHFTAAHADHIVHIILNGGKGREF